MYSCIFDLITVEVIKINNKNFIFKYYFFRTWYPLHFTYYGFRYTRLKKWKGPVNICGFVGCVVYSGVNLVNKLISNSLWSQKDNFFDIPTDCSQRAERLGWTGDAQIFSKTAIFNMDCYSFYRKFLKDLFLLQIRDD